jgi:hypothetical protein
LTDGEAEASVRPNAALDAELDCQTRENAATRLTRTFLGAFLFPLGLLSPTLHGDHPYLVSKQFYRLGNVNWSDKLPDFSFSFLAGNRKSINLGWFECQGSRIWKSIAKPQRTTVSKFFE